MNFGESTQRANWLFTADSLVEIRKRNREQAIETIRRVRSDYGTSESSGQAPDSEVTGTQPQKLKAVRLEEEQQLCKYYQGKVQEVCRGFKFPAKVAATAVSYLKRFYLGCSTMDHDPKDIMLTCIYLACKVEESYISAEEFCKHVGQEESVVLDAELTVLQGLKFDLIVHTPVGPLAGFFQDLQDWREEAGGSVEEGLRGMDEETLARGRATAAASADALLLTDAPLLFPPGQLALAALRSAFRKLKLPFSAYLARVVEQAAPDPTQPAPERLQQLQDALARIDELGAEGAKPVVAEEVRKIDRKLKLCRNPLLDPASVVYKRAQARKEAERVALREKKIQERQAAYARAVADLTTAQVALPAQPSAPNGGSAMDDFMEEAPQQLNLECNGARRADHKRTADGITDLEDNSFIKRRKSTPTSY